MDEHISNLISLTEAFRAFNTQTNPSSEVATLFNSAIKNELNGIVKAQVLVPSKTTDDEISF